MSIIVRDLSIAVPGRPGVISAKEYSRKLHGDSETSDIAVIAHPYGPLGGSQSDPVVTHLARHFAQRNTRAFTFDFSSPTSFTGRKECAQYLAVVLHALNSIGKVKTLFCCGYSYGTLCLPSQRSVMDSIGHEQRMNYILVSPLLAPVSTFLTFSLSDPYKHVIERPHLAIWGEHDNFTSSKRLKKAWQHDGIMVPAADHFWRQAECLSILTTHIDRFIDNATP